MLSFSFRKPVENSYAVLHDALAVGTIVDRLCTV